MVWRDRDDTKRLCNILEDAEGRRDGLIDKIQELRRFKDDFDWRMEDLGVQGDGGIQLVTYGIEKFQGIFESLKGYIKAAILAEEDKGRCSTTIYKQWRLAEARDNEAEREADELRSNLKSRSEVEGGVPTKYGLRESLREGGERNGGGGGRVLDRDISEITAAYG